MRTQMVVDAGEGKEIIRKKEKTLLGVDGGRCVSHSSGLTHFCMFTIHRQADLVVEYNVEIPYSFRFT